MFLHGNCLNIVIPSREEILAFSLLVKGSFLHIPHLHPHFGIFLAYFSICVPCYYGDGHQRNREQSGCNKHLLTWFPVLTRDLGFSGMACSLLVAEMDQLSWEQALGLQADSHYSALIRPFSLRVMKLRKSSGSLWRRWSTKTNATVNPLQKTNLLKHIHRRVYWAIFFKFNHHEFHIV